MNAGLVKGCLKTELLSVLGRYSRLNHARPESSFLPRFITCCGAPAKTNSTGRAVRYCGTGTSSAGCHGLVYLGIHTSKVPQLEARFMKTFCIPSVQGQNHETGTHPPNLFWGTQELRLDETPCSTRPWDVYLNTGLAADALLLLSVSEEASLGVRRCTLPWRRVWAPVLTYTQGKAHTWVRTWFYVTEGCNFKSQTFVCNWNIDYLVSLFHKKHCGCYQMISDLSKRVWERQKDP